MMNPGQARINVRETDILYIPYAFWVLQFISLPEIHLPGTFPGTLSPAYGTCVLKQNAEKYQAMPACLAKCDRGGSYEEL
jgi:hypothetical protein